MAIARAQVNRPALLLADEPTGLDIHTGAEIRELFDRLQAQGQTIILVTHEHDSAARAHRQIFLKDGLIARDDRTSPARSAGIDGGAA